LEQYQGPKARKLPREVATIKTMLPDLSHVIMTTVEQRMSIMMRSMKTKTWMLMLTQLCACSLQSKG
jgi:hypothetical protein